MKKRIVCVMIALCILLGVAGESFCGGIQTKFLAVNSNKINPDSDKPVHCKYENTIKGITSGLPGNSYLWIVVHPVGSGGYWPQVGAITVHPKKNTWTATFWLGTRGSDLNKKFEILLILMDRAGNKIYLDYLAKGKKTGRYPEIPLPDGHKALDMLNVIKKFN